MSIDSDLADSKQLHWGDTRKSLMMRGIQEMVFINFSDAEHYDVHVNINFDHFSFIIQN